MEDYLKNFDKKEQASIQYSCFYGVPTEGVAGKRFRSEIW